MTVLDPVRNDGLDGELTRQEAEAVLRQLAATSLALPAPHLREPAPPPPPAHPVGDDAEAPLPVDQFRSLLEAVPDALVIVDAAGRIVLVNGQAERMFGYTREELVGQPVELLVPERSRAIHVAKRAGYFAQPRVRAMGEGQPLYGRRKDGHDIPVEISLSPFRSDSGPLVISTIRDISERKKAEAQQERLKKRYRTLVEGIPAVTFLAALDEEDNELYVSPQSEQLLGFSQQEWLEDPVLWHRQLHPDDRERWHVEFARTCSTGEPFRSVYRFVARNGKVVWVHGEAKLVRDEAGRPLFLQGVAFDITGIKEAEEELRALNLNLNQRVAERTRELEMSNKALEQFASRAAHDLQQPAATVKSFQQKLAERYQGQLDSTADFLIARSINAADRMQVLTVDLLAYSRARTQKKMLVPTDLAAALEAACANLQKAIDDSGAEVTTAEEPLPTVLADRTQLEQLFQNLIANALKFRAQERAPHVHVSARRHGDCWTVSITDNGIGIDPEYLERIFGLGERLHTIDQYPGSGIGLATCQTIVERHGGRIWAASAGKDKGSTFAFTLPAGPARSGRQGDDA